jgi:cytochrome c553
VRSLVPPLAAAVLFVAGCGGGGGGSATPTTTGGGGGGQTTTSGGSGGTGGTVTKGNASNGEILFVTNSCGFCHTLKDVAADGTVGPNLDQTKPSYDLVVERVTNGKAPMPSYKDDISAQDIQDLAAYITKVAGE